MVRWCFINFQCQGILHIWILVGQLPTAFAGGAGGGCLDIFSLDYQFSRLSPSLLRSARYRLKYCLKGPLNPRQPTYQIFQLCWPNLTRKIFLSNVMVISCSSSEVTEFYCKREAL